MGKKLYLSQAFVDKLRESAVENGKTDEWFDAWCERWVVIYEMLEER